MKLRHDVLLAFLVILSGCSILNMGGSNRTSKIGELPTKPVYTEPDMQVAKQQAIDVINQIAGEANMVGIKAKSEQSGTLLKTAKVMQIIEGIPVDAISWKDASNVTDLLDDLKDMERDYRDKVTEWEKLMQEISENESKLLEMHKANGTLWSWIVGLGVCLVILCVVFPSVGVPLVFRIIKNLKTGATIAAEKAAAIGEEQMQQVVAAIEESKDKLKDNPDVYNHLLANLKKNTDKQTREVISRAKGRLHI